MAVILGNLLWVLGSLVTPFTVWSSTPLLYLIGGGILTSLGATVFSVNQMSLRQHITPKPLLGRVTAARRFLVFSLAPAGSAIGGILGTALDIQSTLLIGGAVGIASVFLVLFSPVRTVRELADLAKAG